MDGNGAAWPRAVIFDLDGTLIDSAPDITESLNQVLGERGLPALTVADIKTMLGAGLPALLTRALAAHGVAADDVKPLLAELTAVYSQRATRLTTMFEGALDSLNAFRSAGVKMAVCTNKAQPVTDIILRGLEIDHYFNAAIGSRPDLARKPDPAMINLALSAMDAAPAHAVMVGDSSADAAAAKAAGLPVVLASFGYSATPVAQFSPDAIIGSFAELPSALSRLREAP